MEASHDRPAHDLLDRVCRDLQVPVAVLVASAPRRWVVAHTGFDQVAALRALVAALDGNAHVSDSADLLVYGLRSRVQVPVESPVASGLLIAADRRRRWFCAEERRHLQLLSARASGLLAQALPAVDVRGAFPERSRPIAWV